MNPPLKFVNNKIEDYAMQVTFDPVEGEGTGCLQPVPDQKRGPGVCHLYPKGCIQERGQCQRPGEVLLLPVQRIADYVVPEGCTAIGTMCSITFDGLLIRRGIPVNPIGGGVVEIENRTPIRFTHIILYEHTTIDPLQVLISQKTTSVMDVMRKGSGNILANVREFHMEAEPLVGTVLDELASSSYSGILEVGMPNVPLLGVPVIPQFIAIAAIGGTNPMAAIRERDRWVQTQAMKGLMDITRMEEIRDY